MKKYFCLLLLFIAQNIFSQTMRVEGDFSVGIGKYDTIATSDLCVIYKQILQKDSTNKENVEESKMVLQIGKDVSKYANYITIINDSILVNEAVDNKINAEQFQALLNRLRGSGDRVEIYKYHTSKKLAFRKYIGTFTSYEEDMPEFSWEISNYTLNVLGYECRKATCRFRGRDYIAWFAPEIPVSNGPWKFGGLPGMILKAEDSKEMFRFEAVSIYKPTWNIPIYSIKKSVKTTREKYNKAEKRYVENPVAILQNKPGTKLPEGVVYETKLYPYNPMELE